MEHPQSNYDRQVDIGKNIFLGYNQQALIHKFQLQADDSWIYLSYLSTPYRISRKHGGIEAYGNRSWKACREYTTVMTIYDLLCFSQGQDIPALLGQWCTLGTFSVAGGPSADTFTSKYAFFFNEHIPELKAACTGLGGELQPRLAGADVTCKINVTPFFPVLLQFWEGDDDFSPRLLLMWDRNADQFLRFETMFYLQGDLFSRLKNYIDESSR